MILPINLLPDALGVRWGMPKKQCLTLLNAIPLKQSEGYVTIRLLIQERPCEVNLLFDAHGDLMRIESHLYMSRSFWDGYSGEEMDKLEAEYLERYTHLKQYCISVLGAPDFSGAWGTAGYPASQTAAHITYWDLPQGRAQVEYDHPDKEFPILVNVACYLVRD